MYGRALWCLLERLVYELVYILLSVSEKRFLHLTFGSPELVTPKHPCFITLFLPWYATVNEALLGGFEVRGDQVGVELLALRLEVDPVFHEELRPAGACGVPVDENGFVWVPPHPVG